MVLVCKAPGSRRGHAHRSLSVRIPHIVNWCIADAWVSECLRMEVQAMPALVWCGRRWSMGSDEFTCCDR
eukprot:gene9365-biopygen2167